MTTVSGQTTAILIVLMFGAGTDYCLLIVARFRDELRRTADVGEAMARATRAHRPGDPLRGRDRDRGDARARARRLQRHARDGADPRARRRGHGRRRADAAAGDPRARSAGARSGRPSRRSRPSRRPSGALWRRVGRLGRRRTRRRTAGVVTLILLAGALGSLGGREPLDFSEAFRTPPRVGRRRAGDQRALHPGPRGADRTSSRLRGAGGGDLGAHRRARAPLSRRCTYRPLRSPRKARNPNSRWRRPT